MNRGMTYDLMNSQSLVTCTRETSETRKYFAKVDIY